MALTTLDFSALGYSVPPLRDLPWLPDLLYDVAG